MTKPTLILIGAGGHAHSCIDVIEQQGRFQIAGLVGLPEQQHTQHLGYAVIGADTDLPALAKNYQYALISGPDKSYFWLLARTPTIDDNLKKKLIAKAAALGFDTTKLIFS